MTAKVVLVEATTNSFWGFDLPPDQTRHTLSDYWPGKNNMGKILVQLREDLQTDDHTDNHLNEKRKASSPLVNTNKSLKT